MVSDALLNIGSFATGFASAYGAAKRPYFDALAREEATQEINRGRNEKILNGIIENSPSMMNDLSSSERQSVLNNMLKVHNTSTFYQIAALQAQSGGKDIFSVGKEGVYNTGTNKFVSLTSFKPKNVTEGDRKRQVATDVIAQLSAVSGDDPKKRAEERRKVWNSLTGVEQGLVTEYIYGGTGKVNSQRYAHSTRLGWIKRLDEIPGLGAEFGTYKPNYNNPVVDSIMKNNGITAANRDDSKATLLIIESSDLNDEVLRFYANYLGGVRGMSKVKEGLDRDTDEINQAKQNMIGELVGQESTGQVPSQTSSTQLYTNAGQNYLSQYTKEWFKDKIPDASGRGYDTRALMLNKLQEDIFDRFSNSKWILGNGQDVKDAIMRYLAEQYDMAAEEMAP